MPQPDINGHTVQVKELPCVIRVHMKQPDYAQETD